MTFDPVGFDCHGRSSSASYTLDSIINDSVFVGLVDPADAQKPRQEEKPRPDDVIILKCAWRENLG